MNYNPQSTVQSIEVFNQKLQFHVYQISLYGLKNLVYTQISGPYNNIKVLLYQSVFNKECSVY